MLFRMKKIGLLAVIAGVLGCFAYYNLKNYAAAPPVPGMIRVPGGPNEEKEALREAWERKRYCDPATGKIPEGIAFLERAFVAKMPRAVQHRSGSPWVARGPWNYGGRTRALVMDATNENRLLAGGVSGGVWLSEDGGQSWQRRTPIDAHPSCASIAQDLRPGKTNTWYNLSGEFYWTSASSPGAFYVGDGLYKSTDNGLNWSAVASTAAGNPGAWSSPFQTGWRVITSPVDTADVVYMACVGAIFRSADGGDSWAAVRGTTNLNSAAYFTDVAISSAGVLYAALSSDGVDKGIWRSTDGLQWTDITPANFPATYERIVIGINPNNENEVFFLGSTPGAGHYVKYIDSDDWSSLWKYTYLGGDGAGANGQWEDRSPNLPDTGTEFDRFACQGGYDLVVKVQPGTNHVFAGGTSLWRSTDGFATPNHTAHIAGYKPGTTLPFFELYPNHHPDQHEVLFLPSNPNVMITGSDGGLHRTGDCNAPTVVWSSLNRGYQTTQFYTAIIDPVTPGDHTIIGGLQDNGNLFVNSANAASPWKQTVNGDGAFGAIVKSKGFYILSIQQGRVAKCAINTDGEVTAFRRIDPIGPAKSDYEFINPLAIDPANDNILYLPAGKRLYRQSDLAAIQLTGAWDSIAQGWTQFADTTIGNITAIGVSSQNPAHRVYVGTDTRRVYRIDNADTGAPKMVAVTQPPTGGSNATVSCIAVDPDNANRVIATFSNYNAYSIWLSINGGQTWDKVAGNLEAGTGGGGDGPSVRWLSILPLPDGSRKYFAATSAGLYSADTLLVHTILAAGTQWTLEAPAVIGNSVVEQVVVRPSDGLVVAATHGIGMFSANYMPSVNTLEPGAPPQLRVAPNPAAGYVGFEWSKPPAGPVTLQLYDLNGRLVRQCNWAGDTCRIDLGGLAPGIFLYRLQGKGWRLSGRIVKGT